MKTHNEIYNNLQEEYLKNRDNKILSKMYEIATQISFNYIKKYCQKKGISLNIKELSHDSALFVIEQYLIKSDFKVKKISAYAYFGVIKNLFKNKDSEMNEISYETLCEKNEELYCYGEKNMC
jgi:ribosomal protein S1